MIRRVLPLLWVDFQRFMGFRSCHGTEEVQERDWGGLGDRGSPRGLGFKGGGSSGLSLAHAVP